MCFANLRISAVYIWTALWHVHVCVACLCMCMDWALCHVHVCVTCLCMCMDWALWHVHVCDMFVHVYRPGSLACTCV